MTTHPWCSSEAKVASHERQGRARGGVGGGGGAGARWREANSCMYGLLIS